MWLLSFPNLELMCVGPQWRPTWGVCGSVCNVIALFIIPIVCVWNMCLLCWHFIQPGNNVPVIHSVIAVTQKIIQNLIKKISLLSTITRQPKERTRVLVYQKKQTLPKMTTFRPLWKIFKDFQMFVTDCFCPINQLAVSDTVGKLVIRNTVIRYNHLLRCYWDT